MPYSVYHTVTGQTICYTGTIEDAQMMASLHPNRHYKPVRLLKDQVIDITSHTPIELSPLKLEDVPSGDTLIPLPESLAQPVIV